MENLIFKYNIKPFNFTQLNAQYSMFLYIRCIFNKKDWLKKSLKANGKPIITVIPHESRGYIYSNITPDHFIYDTYDDSIITRICDRHKLMESKGNPNSQVNLVLDECLTLKGTWKSNPVIMDLFYSHKKSNINLIMSLSYPMNLPDIYVYFDWVILGPEHSPATIKRLYNLFGNFIENPDDFVQLYKYFTEHNLVMCICNKSTSTNINDRIKFFKPSKKM